LLEPIGIPGLVRAAHVGFLVSCLLSPLALAQQAIDAAFLEQAPTIDGTIGEAEWAGAGLIDQGLVQFAPDFGIESPYRTVVRVGQTETSLP